MTLDTRPVDVRVLSLTHREEKPTAWFRARVEAARDIQTRRFRDVPGVLCNAQMGPKLLRVHCVSTPGAAKLLERSVERFGLSARAHDRILKMARTRADLEGHPSITDEDMQFAVGCRVLDRNGWLAAAQTPVPIALKGGRATGRREK